MERLANLQLLLGQSFGNFEIFVKCDPCPPRTCRRTKAGEGRMSVSRAEREHRVRPERSPSFCMKTVRVKVSYGTQTPSFCAFAGGNNPRSRSIAWTF